MTQNPFEALGGEGGFDMGALLQQAQAMQEQLMDAQRKLADSLVTGSVADGAVSVTVDGTGELVRVDLREGVLEGTDAESLAELGDLVVAAFRDAKSKVDQQASEALGPLAGGLGGLAGGGAAGGSGASGGPLPGPTGRMPGSGGFGF
ncbi:YbaB/EbfC family nucleoid-associated protein [Nocardioides sp. GY 10127]|uniref:YbaB/EbfC family nucleoid-associated protein n=1 Tax=Nocardioides sp. GY 10127 TaxID=2569762 RepID=UPI0010A7D59F|nr:YbaB/EbfC family nucleoid-associated protein [Nocardioides sp. GY 10127]TIC82526.1 YbaB/EbfC family nucleoid-associated protein [Nocardioides sp. GY 10127]